ncbi:MAG: FG-GAP-like repeat-containing protein [Pyrinomonadaceae bacterium]
MHYFTMNTALRYAAVLLLLSAGAFSQGLKLPTSKTAMSAIMDSRPIDGRGFVVMTEDEFRELAAAGDLAGDPCSVAAPITPGQTISGSLTVTDCRLDDGTYGDFYIFGGTAGQQVTINLSSTAFDTYLGLANESGTFVVEDDDGGGGTNSRISVSLPETTNYIILANSVFPNSFGSYTLSLDSPAACSYTLTPASADVPGLGGNFSFTVTTTPGCRWFANTQSSFVTINGPGNGLGSATISYTVASNQGGGARTATINVSGQTFTINQAAYPCSYSVTPAGALHGPDGGTFTFDVQTPVGCGWYATYGQNVYWLWTSNEVRYGPGTVSYTVQPNNGGDRAGAISLIRGLETVAAFPVTQTGRNCTYTVSPTSVRVPAPGGTGTIGVTTQLGCTWSFFAGSSWLEFPTGAGGTGPGTVSWRAYGNSSFNSRQLTALFSGPGGSNVLFQQSGIPYRTRFDFFGDSKADISIFRPSTGEWYLWDSQANGVYANIFGVASDVLVPGDYTGDRLTDIAVFRPSNGTWYVFDRTTNSFFAAQFGVGDDIPTPADFDGDGKTDLAVFRPSNGVWYIRHSASGTVTFTSFGTSGDKPVASDYDGDGKADIAVWRPSVGQWWILYSSNQTIFAAEFGSSTDKAVPGDYTGDGWADIAFYRPSSGYWYVLRSQESSYYAFPFGTSGDLPAPADYDSDGMIDAAVFRPSNSTWYINRTSLPPRTAVFGSPGDVPVPGAYVR